MKIDILNAKKKYDVIYADPPWSFLTYSNKGKGRSAEKHYQTMTKEDIQNLPIDNIAKKDCVLFLWVTSPNLIEGIELIEKWGFTYKTVAFTWVKKCKKSENIFTGLGYYTRQNAEYCLLATRGKPLKRESKKVSSVVISHLEEHSKKPSEIRDRIVELYGDKDRVELFARQEVKGWDAFGNEV